LTASILVKLFEHNNWANLRIIAACAALTDELLDATPGGASTWSIRRVLSHVVEAQQNYFSLLTLPPEARRSASVAYAELAESARSSGEALLSLAREETAEQLATRLRTRDGYFVERWVVMVQAINHGAEHRRQVAGMMRAHGVAPPVLDGWAFAEAVGALVPASA
jgi:uncharacterized damage-inducible protein DinB